MNRKKVYQLSRTILALFACALLTSCYPSDDFNLDEPFTVKYGETLVNYEENVSITLVDVRDGLCYAFCPRNGYCYGVCTDPGIFYSTAVINIDVDGKVVTNIELDYNGGPVEYNIYGLRFKLLSISPKLKLNDRTIKSAYEMEFVIERI